MTTFTAYHGTNASFRRFDPKRGAQGIIWFSSDRETIERGESGAQGTARILELRVTIDRPAGWREYDQLMLDQIESRGFDGVLLPRKDGFDGFVFDPSQIEIVKTKPRYHENPTRLRPYVVRGRIWNGTSWDFVKADVQAKSRSEAYAQGAHEIVKMAGWHGGTGERRQYFLDAYAEDAPRKHNPISRADVEDLGRAYIEGEDIARSPEAQAMAREQAGRVHREFDKLRRHLRIEFTERDPYASFEELVADVKGQGRMQVYTGSSETPLWDERTNWMARAVHDWDHVQAMVDFSLPGELAAYRVAAAKAPLLSPIYLSDIALQAASYHVLGGAFAPGPQKLVRPSERIARRARELRNNPSLTPDDVLLASTLLRFMDEEEVMAHLAAKGMGKMDAEIATEGAIEMLHPETLIP